MSLLRGPRPRGPWAPGRKGPRKPAAAKRDWDSTVHDLTVHRATPEDILRRHELHKSKNKALVHLELQEKALRRKWKKQKQVAPGSLEKRKLTLMREALNEVKEETSSICQSEDEQHDSLNFKSSINSDRLLQLLREKNSSVDSQLWTEKEMRKTTLSQEANVPLTPTTASPSLEHSALNATGVVKRIHSRLLNEEGEETADSAYTVRQVLNPDSRKQKQISAKVKRKQIAQNSSGQRTGDSHANSIPTGLPRDSKSTLDVLNCMIHEVEHELEEYEQCTGREVQKTQRNEGLTGFTLSLVNALCRLMRYLKESETQLREKEMMRQQHEEMLKEHRELIDALTAEILLVREENIAVQKLQQYMIATDEQLTSLVQALKGLPLGESKRGQSPNHFGIASKGSANSQEKSALSYFEPRTGAGNGVNMLKFPHKETPVEFFQRPSVSDSVGAGRSLPTHIFQPAVLLSPPRQKSSQESSPLQNVFKTISQSTENTEREPCKERTSPSSLVTQSTAEEKCLFSQRQPIPPAHKDLESSQDKVSLSSPSDSGKNSAAEEVSQSSDLLGQIAELTRQNSLIKAQLSKFRDCSEETGDGLHQPDAIQNIYPSLDTSQGQTHLAVPKSLEERIAELNRQSAEARDKLLQLIDQQKLAAAHVVSPMISAIPPPSLNYIENAKKTIEVSIPMASVIDSSKEDTPSPASVTSIRRSAGSSSKPCSPLSATSESVKLSPVSQRPKQVEKQKEEGWFALSMHIM
ncbi:spindle and centriole-associated protein 1 isoform X6 [Struthio camelus]|uniref:spindle and centriole-associated protein 1 isoform X6 n=1 Tax=Struthio camelus TaxID=8801 RepID=UPI003604044A